MTAAVLSISIARTSIDIKGCSLLKYEKTRKESISDMKTVKMQKDEVWWGGTVVSAIHMPFDSKTEYRIDLANERTTQTAPLLLSNKGRAVWCEEPFILDIKSGIIKVITKADVELKKHGSTLRDAYLGAMKDRFPFEKDIHTPREYYEHPQFNTWMELIKNQNTKDILQYAGEVIEHGYKPGIFVIDGGWQECQGVWSFRKELIPDPKYLTDELHKLGFKVLIWVSPFICPEGEEFLKLKDIPSLNTHKENTGHLVRNGKGEVAIQKWWSGFGAILNLNLPGDAEYLKNQLDALINEYGFDGFKFDGGAFLENSFINAEDFLGSYTCADFNNAWVDFGRQYKFHEFKDTFKQGGKAVIQRLWDKRHRWHDNGLDCLIPHGCFLGLIGSPFFCPDMVGGGSWTAFVYGEHDEELFIRMAQCSALFPMMQFSSLPWRHLSENGVRLCKEMAELHERMFPTIEEILSESEKSGEPIVRSMEYEFPHSGYERINDQFLLGHDILVSPVLEKGMTKRTVRIPVGSWQEQNTKEIFSGPCEIEVKAELDTLPWFIKTK